MSIPRRRLGFYSIVAYTGGAEREVQSSKKIIKLIAHINSLAKQKRIYDLRNSNKCHLIEEFIEKRGYSEAVFKSAKYKHLPPLIDSRTGVERPSPKSLEEGEAEVTHLVAKCSPDDEELICILEERGSGIRIKTLEWYLKAFLDSYNESCPIHDQIHTIESRIIPKEDFLEELEKLERVFLAEVQYDKQMLGDEFINFAKRDQAVREDITLTLKAVRGRTIFDTVVTFFNKSRRSSEGIKKIRVVGYTEEHQQVVLDTDLIKRLESVEVDIDILTGLVNSDDILRKMAHIINSI